MVAHQDQARINRLYQGSKILMLRVSPDDSWYSVQWAADATTGHFGCRENWRASTICSRQRSAGAKRL